MSGAFVTKGGGAMNGCRRALTIVVCTLMMCVCSVAAGWGKDYYVDAVRGADRNGGDTSCSLAERGAGE